MANIYKSRYTGEQIDSYLGDVETLKDQQTEDRLNTLEKWMENANYRAITVSTTSPMATLLFGDSVKDQTLTWSISKKAKKIEIVLPNNRGTVNVTDEETVDLSGNRQSSYTDPNEYKLTSALQWTIKATEDNGKDTGNVDAEGNPIITYAVGTAYPRVAMNYLVFWGTGTQTDGFDTEFFEGLSSVPATSKNGSFDIGSISSEYVYYAAPKTLIGTTEVKFDLHENGFMDNFAQILVYDEETDTMIPEITLVFNGEPLEYYLYRSMNLLTSDKPFKLAVK